MGGGSLHLRTDILAHGFPATNEPLLPIFTKLVLTGLGISHSCAFQTWTTHLQTPFTGGNVHTGHYLARTLRRRRRCTNRPEYPLADPEKRMPDPGEWVCDGDLYSR